MKHLMIGATLVVGLTCIGTAIIAHENEQLVEPDDGFAVMALIAHVPAEFAKAQREAGMMEARHQLGPGPPTIVARAIDESPGSLPRRQSVQAPWRGCRVNEDDGGRAQRIDRSDGDYAAGRRPWAGPVPAFVVMVANPTT